MMLWRQRIEVPPSVVPYQSEWIVGLWTVGIALSRTDRQVEQRTVGRTNFLALARANPGTVPVPVQGGGAFLPLLRGWGGCSTQRGLAQRDPLSTLGKFRTRQRTRQLLFSPNAESPALAGLWCWYCYVFFWLRGRTTTVNCRGLSAWCETRALKTRHPADV
jgi:hypothetical protein